MSEPLNCTEQELCTYLAALAEGYLATSCLDTTLCVQSRLIPIASKSYQHGKKTVFFHGFPSLTMCKPLTAQDGEDLLTSYAEAFRAKTSVLQEKAKALEEKNLAFGSTWRELSVKYDRSTHGWKTHQCLWEEDLIPSSLTLPRWGMMQSGVLWERTTPLPSTNETESGFWRTPQRFDGLRGGKSPELYQECLKTGRLQITLTDQVKMFPTPVARDWKGASGRSYKGEELDLPAFCQRFPTPNASDYIQRKTSKSWTEQGRTNYVLSNPEVTGITGGQLNPDWVELLMGYPLGWTRLEPLPIAEFNLWYEGNTTKENDRYGAVAWQSGTWEQGITRTVGKGFPHRRERLQAIGNGQVPQALRIAWSILMG